MPIRLLILASTPAMRAGLRALLLDDPALEVVEHAASYAGNLVLESVDVIVAADAELDLASLAGDLESAEPPPALLLLSDQAEDGARLARLPLRAWGLLPPDCSEEELLAAAHALHAGLLAGAPSLMQPALHAVLAVQPEERALLEELTPRENEVLQLLAYGLANKQIALELDISEHTIKFHSSAIYAKLGVTNRTEAVRMGARLGLISL